MADQVGHDGRSLRRRRLSLFRRGSCVSLLGKVRRRSGGMSRRVFLLPGRLEAGAQYNIALQIGQDKVTLGDIDAEPWVPSTGGVLETE